MKAVFFDMDGTLLPMDMDVFERTYFGLLCKRLAQYGYTKDKLIDGIWRGTYAMIKNDGRKLNSELFWEVMAGIFGEQILADVPLFDEFYKNEFLGIKECVGFEPRAGELVKRLKAAGYTIVVATNPFFPMVAQLERLKMAGVDRNDVAYVSSYENSHYCKPEPKYFVEILELLGLDAADCIMIGNDATDDMSARAAGLDVFLLTDCLVNTKNVDISAYPHGSYPELYDYLAQKTGIRFDG